jgi:hypothetical protein
MYEQLVSRSNPGCVVFLLDRSDSMKEPWAGSPGMSLAEGAAHAINKILHDLCMRGQKERGAPPRHYFDLGVFGYGRSAVVDDERVESALGGALTGKALVPMTELAQNPLGLVDIQVSVDAPPVKTPIWVEPIHGYRTPMCEAIATAGGHIANWVSAHPDSFPPIVINITDGAVTDSPFQEATLDEWARRLSTLQTSDGQALLFNCFLSANPAPPSLFPCVPDGLPEPGPALFEISSILPARMVENANKAGFPLGPQARGLGFNMNMATLVKFLEIGTTTEKKNDA